MKREDLKAAGFSDEQIEAVMKLHGESVKEIVKRGETAALLAAEVTELKNQLTDAGKTIEDFKKLDIDGIKKASDEWKAKAEKAEKDSAEKIESLSRQSAAKEYAAGIKFSSNAAKKQFISDFLESGLKFKDGSFLGADDFRTKYAEQDPGIFQSETPAGQVDTGAKHNNSDMPISDRMNSGIIGALSKS